MRVPEFLFFLIKSLTQAEKRYFKMNSNFQSGDEKRYIQIFDTIDKMEKYDEKALLKIVDKKKLSVTKNFLYHKILRSLRNYNERSSIDIELNNLIIEATILIEKGLMHPALKQLRKAKKIALEYDKQWFLVKIADYELEINRTIWHKDILTSLGDITTEARSALAECNKTYELKYLYHELCAKHIVRKGLDIEDEKKKIPDSPDSLNSFHAKSYYYLSKSLISLIEGDIESQKEHSKKIIDIWESNSKIVKYNIPNYIIYLTNYLNSCIAIGQFDNFTDKIEIMKQLPCRSKYQRALMFQNVSFLELIYYINIFQLDKATEIIPDIEKNILRYRGLINKAREISFFYNIALLYFLLEKYKDANKWLNKILYDPKSEVRHDIKRFAWILEIIIHYELGNEEVIKHIFDSYKNWLYRSNSHPLEMSSYRHLKKILFAPLKDRKKLLKEFKIDLDKYQKDNFHFGLEELSIWVEARLTNKSLAEVHKSRIVGAETK